MLPQAVVNVRQLAATEDSASPVPEMANYFAENGSGSVRCQFFVQASRTTSLSVFRFAIARSMNSL